MFAHYSERCCRLRDDIGRQTLPPVVPETQELEKRRRDNSWFVLSKISNLLVAIFSIESMKNGLIGFERYVDERE